MCLAMSVPSSQTSPWDKVLKCISLFAIIATTLNAIFSTSCWQQIHGICTKPFIVFGATTMLVVFLVCDDVEICKKLVVIWKEIQVNLATVFVHYYWSSLLLSVIAINGSVLNNHIVIGAMTAIFLFVVVCWCKVWDAGSL